MRIVVPFAAGGTTDILARAVAPELSKAFGQQFIVDNRAGAGGNVGAEIVARAPNDGYTLLMGTVGTHGINRALYPKLPFDPIKDFAPITLVAAVPNVMEMNADKAKTLNIRNVQDFIKYAKANPGKLNMASSGSGTSIHLGGRAVQEHDGHVHGAHPVQGLGPGAAGHGGRQRRRDVRQPALVDGADQGRQAHRPGRDERAAFACPAGHSDRGRSGRPVAQGLRGELGFGLLAPAGTSPEIVNRIQQEVAKSLGTPAIKEKMLAQARDSERNSPADFTKLIASEHVKWAKVVKDSGAKVD